MVKFIYKVSKYFLTKHFYDIFLHYSLLQFYIIFVIWKKHGNAIKSMKSFTNFVAINRIKVHYNASIKIDQTLKAVYNRPQIHLNKSYSLKTIHKCYTCDAIR